MIKVKIMELKLFNGLKKEQKIKAIKTGVLFTVIFLLIHTLLINELIEGIAYSLLVFVLSVLIISIYFKRRKQKKN